MRESPNKDTSFVAEFKQHLNGIAELPQPQLPATPEAATEPKPGVHGDAQFYAHYRALATKSEVRLSDDIEEPLPCLEIAEGDQFLPFATLGNFSLIIGKAKSRKTFLLSAAVAAFIKADTVMGKIRGRRSTDKTAVLYFDTEQHKGQVKKVLRRIAQLADADQALPIRVFHLKKHAPNHRLNIIRVLIEDTPNLGLIVIDGIRDTVFDINDAKEATERATDLLQWTEEKDAHLITVIHENKGNANARGHLGTELVNKAESVISVAKDQADKNTSIVTPEYCRDKEFEPFGFAVDESGLPVLVDGISADVNGKFAKAKKPTVDDLKPDQIEAILHRAFSNDEQLRYSQLRINITEASEHIGVSMAKSRAEEFIRRIEAVGYLIKFKPIKAQHNQYKINPDKLPIPLS